MADKSTLTRPLQTHAITKRYGRGARWQLGNNIATSEATCHHKTVVCEAKSGCKMKSREHARKTSKDASKHRHTIESCCENVPSKKRKYAKQSMGANWRVGTSKREPLKKRGKKNAMQQKASELHGGR